MAHNIPPLSNYWGGYIPSIPPSLTPLAATTDVLEYFTDYHRSPLLKSGVSFDQQINSSALLLTSRLEDRAFAAVGPRLCNSLPTECPST